MKSDLALSLSEDQENFLRSVALDSLKYGLENGKSLPIDLDKIEPDLKKYGACFVTLRIKDALRGCVGSLEAEEPLVQNVSVNAFRSAFDDSRFDKITSLELKKISIAISVLSEPKRLAIRSEEDLLEQLKPGIDGLVLKEKEKKATFLPSVWRQIPEKKEFLRQLKKKAGLHENYWSDKIQIFNYFTVTF